MTATKTPSTIHRTPISSLSPCIDRNLATLNAFAGHLTIYGWVASLRRRKTDAFGFLKLRGAGAVHRDDALEMLRSLAARWGYNTPIAETVENIGNDPEEEPDEDDEEGFDEDDDLEEDDEDLEEDDLEEDDFDEEDEEDDEDDND